MEASEDRAIAEKAIHCNIAEVLTAMREASARAGRKPEDTRLLVVSKTWPAELIRLAASYPQSDFGESRVQELVQKAPALPDALRWHFIGHLQKNKIRRIVSVCSVLHSVDSLELARRIDRIAGEEGAHPDVYLQVNIAKDAAKSGFSAELIGDQLGEVLALPNLNVLGLMTIPEFTPNPEDARPHFTALRQLRDALEGAFAVRLPGLSMGMSADFEVAIEEGSTVVRVGSAIFGGRQPTAGGN